MIGTPRTSSIRVMMFATMAVAAAIMAFASQTNNPGLSGASSTNAVVQSTNIVHRDFAGDEDLEADPKKDVPTLDKFHKATFETFQGNVTRIDRFFADDEHDEEVLEENSSFKLSLSLQFKEDGGVNVSFDPSLDVRLKMPQMEKRLHLFIDNGSLSDLPGLDPSERDQTISSGLRGTLSRKHISLLNASAGIKWRTPPVLFAEVKLGREFEYGKWAFKPQQKLFWQSDDGFGEVTELNIDWDISRNWLGRSTSAAKWTEVSKGLEWEQTFRLGLLLRGVKDQPKKSIGFRASAFGHKSGAGVVDRYRFSMGYRWAVYKRWLYFQITPEVEFPRSRNFSFTPSIRFGVDALFWGTPMR